ncbi:hypothetical protein FF1_040467 [Malus domestica]
MVMPNHAICCFKLPIGLCRDIEKAIMNYWWKGNDQRKGVHWASWNRLMKQKKHEGLGFKDIQCFNLAFLEKIGWRLIQNLESLLVRVLRDTYFPRKTFRKANGGRRTSWGWKGIFEARNVLNNGILWRVGDGTSKNIREDPWLPKPTTFKALVSDLIDPKTKNWNADKIKAGFNRDDVSLILSIPLSRTGCRDRLVWYHAANGVFTVKFGYGITMGLMENEW